MTEDYVSLSAGPIHWNGIREMAATLGLRIEESRGWFTRHFVLRGDRESLLRAKKLIEEFEQRKEALTSAAE